MKISIVCPTWSEKTRPYLDACVDSISKLNRDGFGLETIVIGRPGYMPFYDNVITTSPRMDNFSPEFAMNWAAKMIAADTTHLLFINDDVIFTRQSLKNLVDIAGNNDGLFMPISPCDNYWKYQLHFGFEKAGQFYQLPERFYRLEQLKDYLPELMAAESVYPPGAIMADMLCTFCVLIPRKTWGAIGEWDEGFSLGQCDFDYCLRARQLNIPRVIALNSLVWHFGGATSNDTQSIPRRVKNAQYFKSKWGYFPDGFDERLITA